MKYNVGVFGIVSVCIVLLSGCTSVIRYAERFLPAPYSPEALIEFGSCVQQTGFVLYITTECHSCTDQINLFGSGADTIKIINCDDPQAECFAMGIQSYPTWLGTQGGGVYVGMQALETLAGVSGCPLIMSIE